MHIVSFTVYHGMFYKQPAELKMPKETLSGMVWPGGQKFQGRTKIFNTIAEKFYPRIKIFKGTIFFLTQALLRRRCMYSV